MARTKNIAVSVAAIHIGEKSVAIWEQFPERGRAISHPFDIFQPLLKEQIFLVTLGILCSVSHILKKARGHFAQKPGVPFLPGGHCFWP